MLTLTTFLGTAGDQPVNTVSLRARYCIASIHNDKAKGNKTTKNHKLEKPQCGVRINVPKG